MSNIKQIIIVIVVLVMFNSCDPNHRNKQIKPEIVCFAIYTLCITDPDAESVRNKDKNYCNNQLVQCLFLPPE
jgi:hypothetical protein